MPRNEIKMTKEMAEYLESLTECVLSDDGQELFNPIPNKLPGENNDINLIALKKQMLGKELSHLARLQGFETLEEANDFDIEDDIDKVVFNSRHEVMEHEEPDYMAKPKEEEQIPGPPKDGAGGSGSDDGDGMAALKEVIEGLKKDLEEVRKMRT